MKTLIVVLILAAFLQATILPISLVLIILICRAYIRRDKTNLFLAFSFGMLTSHLSIRPIGFDSITFLLTVLITQLLARTRLSQHPLWIVPISFIMLSLNFVVLSLISGSSIQLFPKALVETALSLPIFYSLRIWEERFIVRKEIKLRV